MNWIKFNTSFSGFCRIQKQWRRQQISCVSLTLHYTRTLSCYITSQSDSPRTRRPLTVPGVILATWTHVFIAHNIRNSESLTPCFHNSVCLCACLCECECVCMNRQECVSVYLRAGCLSQSCSVTLCCAEVTGTVLITVFFTVLITVHSLDVLIFMPLIFLHNCSLLYQYLICIPHTFLM